MIAIALDEVEIIGSPRMVNTVVANALPSGRKLFYPEHTFWA
tara:strand:- start:525 stop:650 length:126 start_codon:yes stop_codon:yes gene_type:complete